MCKPAAGGKLSWATVKERGTPSDPGSFVVTRLDGGCEWTTYGEQPCAGAERLPVGFDLPHRGVERADVPRLRATTQKRTRPVPVAVEIATSGSVLSNLAHAPPESRGIRPVPRTVTSSVPEIPA